MDSLEDKLFEILDKKLRQLESESTFGIEQNRQSRINEMWSECLNNSNLKRIGKLMGILTEKNNDEVWVKDPLSDGFVILSQEIALKITSLGYVP